MTSEPISIKRYPNRRFYARHKSKYVSLTEIEQFVKDGDRIEIKDSQTGEDLTRVVLTQILVERHPEKMLLFPTEMLHLILRSNDVMADFLRDYFLQSLTYLDYLQKHGGTTTKFAPPMHWLSAWMEGLTPNARDANGPAPPASAENSSPEEPDSDALASRVEELEARIRQLEEGDRPD